MSKVYIDEAYREIIKEVSEWMVDEYTNYPEVQDDCIHSAEMLNHGRLIRDLVDDKDVVLTLIDDSLYYLNYAINDLICNSDKREKLINVNLDNLKKIGLDLEKLIQEVKRNEKN